MTSLFRVGGCAATVLLAVLVTAPLPGTAWAQAPTPPAAARFHYERGTQHYNLGRFEEAISEYRKAYEIKADPVFLFNIAQAYRQLGITEKALFFYRRYLSANPNAANRAQVEERISQLQALVDEQRKNPVAVDRAPGEGKAPDGGSLAPAATGSTQRSPELGARVRSTGAETGVSLEAPPPAPHTAPKPLWTRWWIWAAAGTLVLGSVALAVALSGADGLEIPSTALGHKRFF